MQLFGGASWPGPREEGLDEKFGTTWGSWAGCRASGQSTSVPAWPVRVQPAQGQPGGYLPFLAGVGLWEGAGSEC